MHKRRLTVAASLAFALVLTGLAMSNAAKADEIFRWVDDEGVVHFSQWAPPQDIDNVATLIVHSTNPPDYDPANDPYSIGNQAARTSETWQALEAQREDRRERRLEAEERERKRQESQRYVYQPYPYYSRPFYHRPIHLPVRPPGHQPRPPHVRPPIYPGKPVWPIMSKSEWPDPMRSAHIGVRRRPPPNSRTDL